MKKALTVLLCLALMLLMLTGCASQDIAKAKTAYANGDYQTVVELLENLKTNKPEAAELLNNAKIHLAFDAGDYQQVVDLIGSENANEEIAKLLEDAQAALDAAAAEEEAKLAAEEKLAEVQAAFDAEDYQQVVDLVGDEDAGNEALAKLKEEAQSALDAAQQAAEEKLAEVQAAFDAGDYQQVVDLVGDEDAGNEALAKLKEEAQTALEAAQQAAEEKLAEVQAAFDAEDYQQVVDLVGDEDAGNEALAKLKEEAQTALEAAQQAAEEKLAEVQAAFDAEDYQQVVDLVGDEGDGNEALAKLKEKAQTALEAAQKAAEEKLAEVQAAFDAEDYQQVVDLVGDEDDGNETLAKLKEEAQTALEAAQKAAEEKLAEVQAAFDAEDFQQVLDLVGDKDAGNEALAKLKEEAQTALEAAQKAAEEKLAEVQAAFDAEDYQQVVDLVGDEDAGNEALAKLKEEAEAALESIKKAAEEKLAEAQAAFDAEDYQQVVDLVGDEDFGNETIAKLKEDAEAALEAIKQAAAEKLAEAQAAFDAKDFQQVVDLVGDEDFGDDAIAKLKEDAEAALEAAAAKLAEVQSAFDAGNYQQVMDLIGDEDAGSEELEGIRQEAEVQLAYQNGEYDRVVSLLAEDPDKASNETYVNAVRKSSEQAILDTNDDRYIQMPGEDSYLTEPKTMYICHRDYDWCTPIIIEDPDELPLQQKVCGPGVPVERVPKLRTGRLAMPFAFEGTKVTVLAEENDMSCIRYLSNDNKLRCGWVQTRFLVDTFPGRLLTIGEEKTENADVISDVSMHWSQNGFLNSLQKYSVLDEPVKNCVGFTLEYQLIQENTDKWGCIYGPRTVYVNDGNDWIKVGSFDYPEQGVVKVSVYLEEPTDIVAIGTIAEVGMPNTFFFRQNATDFLVTE